MLSFSGKQNQMDLSGRPEVIVRNDARQEQACGPISYQWITRQSPLGSHAASAEQKDPGLPCYIFKTSLSRTCTPEAAAATTAAAAATTSSAAAVYKQAQSKPDSGLLTCELAKQEPTAVSRNCVQPKSKSHRELELLMKPDLEHDAINSKRRWQKLNEATRRVSYSWVQQSQQEPRKQSGETFDCELCPSLIKFSWVDPKTVTYRLSGDPTRQKANPENTIK